MSKGFPSWMPSWYEYYQLLEQIHPLCFSWLILKCLWNLFFMVWLCEQNPCPLAWNDFICSSENILDANTVGWTLLWGSKPLTSPPCHLYVPSFAFSFIRPSVFHISRLPFSLNKWRNACAYFLNLVQGHSHQAMVWLTGKRAGMAQRFSVCLLLPAV